MGTFWPAVLKCMGCVCPAFLTCHLCTPSSWYCVHFCVWNLQQLAAKEAECRQKDESNREKDEVIREKSATIRAQQAEIQQLRDQLAVSHKMSWHTLEYTPASLPWLNSISRWLLNVRIGQHIIGAPKRATYECVSLVLSVSKSGVAPLCPLAILRLHNI